MVQHYIKKCKCGVVISQCRCIHHNKREVIGMCAECFAKTVPENDQRQADVGRAGKALGLTHLEIGAWRVPLNDLWDRAAKANEAQWSDCPECGYMVSVDEDGCCVSCGRDALRYGTKDQNRHAGNAAKLKAIEKMCIKGGKKNLVVSKVFNNQIHEYIEVCHIHRIINEEGESDD